MLNDNDTHTIIDSNGVFSNIDNYKYAFPLLIKGNDPFLSEISLSLCMARDDDYRMPKINEIFGWIYKSSVIL